MRIQYELKLSLSSADSQRGAAEAVLKQLQDSPDMWTRVDTILETSTNPSTKFFALQVGERARGEWRHWAEGRDPRVCAAGAAVFGDALLSAPFMEDTTRRGALTTLLALQVLESLIKYRWGAIPAEQREGIKNYISSVVIKARFAAPASATRLPLSSCAARRRLFARGSSSVVPSIPFSFVRCPPTRLPSGGTGTT